MACERIVQIGGAKRAVHFIERPENLQEWLTAWGRGRPIG
jgi:hypothetical protein